MLPINTRVSNSDPLPNPTINTPNTDSLRATQFNFFPPTMSADSFTHSFAPEETDGESRPASTAHPFDNDDEAGYAPYAAFSTFNDTESVKDSIDGSVPIYNAHSSYKGDDVFVSSQPIPDTPSPTSIYAGNGGFSTFSPEMNGKPFEDGFVQSDGPILPDPIEMEPEEGFVLREWRRQNAIQLAEKEKKEKELLDQITEEAVEFKNEFYRKRIVTIDTNKSTNREKEKVFVANQEKFHAEADKNYWKTIADLIPHEVPAIEKRKSKKDQDKKPSIVVVQGPKPGKPTDLTRMRHILLKLKHNPPSHMQTSPPPVPEPVKDATPAPVAVA